MTPIPLSIFPYISATTQTAIKFGDERIEVTKEYTYLGILSRNSGSYASAAKKFVSTANFGFGSVLNVLNRVRADSWSSYIKLYQSLIVSTSSQLSFMFCMLELAEKGSIIF